jgi:hypothetical protein
MSFIVLGQEQQEQKQLQGKRNGERGNQTSKRGNGNGAIDRNCNVTGAGALGQLQ